MVTSNVYSVFLQEFYFCDSLPAVKKVPSTPFGTESSLLFVDSWLS